jgi:class 3 adenylate cyclase/tetratricopeptide (TPR) repeat protein
VLRCADCGTEAEPGQKFCGECGSALARACTACGTPNPPGRKFCGECGAPLDAAVAAPAPRDAPAVERRVVSVLFADLVGFTSLSESRDAEDTRALLSRYFETCERLVSLYGGTVEKFIGDAVMALWGAPVAQEDDAERAVRTALDLVAAVEELGEELGAPGLRARAGVLTGEAAVTLGAQGQGMVAGDLVNTASRLQSVAEPGTVLVGETTKRASEAAIAYESAGTFELKGKVEPVPLWRALRVTAGRGGALKSVRLEPPFVGRDRELRLVKELFHASAAERKAHLVSVVGIAGIGKSRLAWEFEKYVDGLADTMFWWRGRCLAYGEGVAFWALAEMVRTRADIVEGEEPQSARRKLRAGIEPYIDDPDELAWIEPRLAHLLGLEGEAAYERQDLFGAWRLYFERLSEHQPIVLVFEDLQWADASLLEFVEHLLDWSRAYPIFVLTLARPDLTERSPGWGAGGRNFSSLFLEPLSEDAMAQMLSAFVPGLPEDLRAQIMRRAEGVPLYAVETVRMLLDRGLLEEVGGVYRPTGPIEALDVPETLHALVAARLDGLAPAERRLLQNASVLGKTFTRDAVASLDGADGDVDELLQGLVRKEVLSIQLDPRSPERGQYGFLQDLLRQVAYDTLPKRERKARHLAAAAHLERTFGGAEQEVVEVIASHHLAAYEADPEAEDAPVLRERASSLLAEAAHRSASLGAAPEAQRYFDEAAALAAGPLVAAELLEQAGVMAWRAARGGDARIRFEQALRLLEQEGDLRAAARVTGRIGQVDIGENRHAEAIERMERAFATLAPEPDESLAALAHELARAHALHGSLDAAADRVETAIEIAEARGLPEVLAEALNTKGTVLLFRSRVHEGIALQQYALRLALEHDLPTAAIRAYNNVAQLLAALDRHVEAIETQERGIALARRVGERLWEELLTAGLTTQLTTVGRWDEAVALAERLDLPGDEGLEEARTEALMVSRILLERGELDRARTLVDRWIGVARSEDTQVRAMYAVVRAGLQLAEGDAGAALASAEDALAMHEELGWLQPFLPYALTAAVDAASTLGDEAKVESLLAEVDGLAPGRRNPSLDAHRLRLRARLNASRGETAGVERLYAAAERLYREHDLRFWLAVAQLEHGEWLLGEGRHADSEPLLASARETFAELRAAPWLERVPVAV